MAREGETLVDLALGEARLGRPMDTDTLLWWRSATKPLVALSLGLLVEEGKLTWNDTVARHVPEFATRGKEAVSLRHVLTHTAGLRRADVLPETLPWEELIARLCDLPLDDGLPPGSQAGYHLRGSWCLLAEVLRRAGGMPFERFVRTRLLEPLGMETSWIGVPGHWHHAHHDRCAVFYQTRQRQPEHIDAWNSPQAWGRPRPGTNGRGPMRELGRLYAALLRGLRTKVRGLPAPEILREMVTPQRTGMFDATFQLEMDWGLGFIPNPDPGGQGKAPYGYGRHASRRTFGHGGAQCVSAFADPDHGLAVAWGCNGMPGEAAHQRRLVAINNALYEDLGLVP